MIYVFIYRRQWYENWPDLLLFLFRHGKNRKLHRVRYPSVRAITRLIWRFSISSYCGAKKSVLPTIYITQNNSNSLYADMFKTCEQTWRRVKSLFLKICGRGRMKTGDHSIPTLTLTLLVFVTIQNETDQMTCARVSVQRFVYVYINSVVSDLYHSCGRVLGGINRPLPSTKW